MLASDEARAGAWSGDPPRHHLAVDAVSAAEVSAAPTEPSPLVVIVGPTAVGKTELALRIAGEHGGEIVSCDSLQVFRGLDIGSAKATSKQRAAVPHHMLDVVDPDVAYSAAEYAKDARAALRGVRDRGRLAVVVGGTGLYLRALLEGLFAGPSRDEALRRRLEGVANRHGNERLHRYLRHVDVVAAERIATNDRLRIVRALEVYFKTGRRLSDEQARGAAPLEGFHVGVFGIDPGRQALQAAIERRTRAMFEAGLIEEALRLKAAGYNPGLRPLRGIGYRQAFAVIENRLTAEQAEHDIVAETMRYAKRQRTWFRQQLDARWCADVEAARVAVEEWLAREGAVP